MGNAGYIYIYIYIYIYTYIIIIIIINCLASPLGNDLSVAPSKRLDMYKAWTTIVEPRPRIGLQIF